MQRIGTNMELRPTFGTMMRHARLVPAVAAAIAICVLVAAAPADAALSEGSWQTDAPSAAPVGLQPATNAAIAFPTSDLAFGWHYVPTATAYQIQIARQPTAIASCSAATAFQTDSIVTTATTTMPGYDPPLTGTQGTSLWLGTYCWRVRASSGGYGPWSTPNRFSRTWSNVPTNLRFFNDEDGSFPRVAGDADAATGSTSTKVGGYLEWTAVAGAATYDVEVGTSSTFSPTSIVVDRSGIRTPRIALLHLADNTYYWRARARAANGTQGPWASGSRFTVQWNEPAWNDAGNVWPADNSSQPEVRVGWTPVRGASYYEYQLGTSAGCFNDSGVPDDEAPALWGSWVDDEVEVDAAGNPYRLPPIRPDQCRLSAIDSTTINNWVTLADAFDERVFGYVSKDCYVDAEVLCRPADLPDNAVTDLTGSPYDLPGNAVDFEDEPATQIHWRVRPVYVLDPANESGWQVARTEKVYGSWMKYTGGGANRSHRFSLDLPGGGTATSVGTRCDAPSSNPSPGNNGCLEHIGSTMNAATAPGVGDSSSMQVPLLKWSQFPGASGRPYPGGYVVQIARDPYFNSIAKTRYVPFVRSYGYGFQTSLALTDGLPDDAEGTGYWWRVVPCESSLPAPGGTMNACFRWYSDDSGGVPLSVDSSGGQGDGGEAQTFAKRTEIQTRAITGFAGSTPLLQFASPTAATNLDWATGIAGAAVYEVQMARNAFMTEGLVTMRTTMPRIVPFTPVEGGGETELADGTWHYRVRAIDANDLASAWSEVDTFYKRISAPGGTVVGGGGAPVVGAATISWQGVEAATSYTVQWSTDRLFGSGVQTATTLQTSYRITGTAGVYHWRVRANIGAVNGAWSAVDGGGAATSVLPAPRITLGLNRSVLRGPGTVALDGSVLVAGAPRNGVRVLLQAKSTTCNAVGYYQTLGAHTTGAGTETGAVRFTLRPTRNRCYRLAYVDAGTLRTSAPVLVRVVPVATLRMGVTSVRRAALACGVLTMDRAVSGRLYMQYFDGRAWRTATSAVLRTFRTGRVCTRINRSGTFRIRALVDDMNGPGGWELYTASASASVGLRVNDVWRVS